MKKYILIEADTNDGDYIMEKNEITDETLELIMPVIQAIKDFKPYIGTRLDYKSLHGNNFPTNDCCREDLGEKSAKELYGHLEGYDYFREMCPSSEYGIHTISDVTVLVVTEEIKLF